MVRQQQSIVRQAAIAFLIIAATTALRLLLNPALGNRHLFLLYYPVIPLLARFLDFRITVGSVFVCAAAISFFFMGAPYSFAGNSSTDWVALALFVMFGLIVAMVTRNELEALDRAREAEAEAHAAELQVKATLARVQEQAALLDLAHDGIFSFTLDQKIDFWSRGAESMYGYTAAEATGRNPGELLKTVMPFTERKDLIDTTLRNGAWEGNLTQTRKDGTTVVVSSQWVPRMKNGKPDGFLEITRDLTERLRLDEKLRQSAKLESLGVMAGGIAHDFNNLLVGIMGNASLALDATPPGHPNYGLLENTIKGSQRAASLTRQLLAYAGKGSFVVRPVNLSELIRDIMDLIHASLLKGVSIEFNLDPSLPQVEADAAQMQQIIMNLVINASEAMETRRGAVVVSTRVIDLPAEECRRYSMVGELSPGTYVVLEVTDHGVGMEPDVIDRIFDPFFTTKFQGRGLGLAAVQGIVRAHHGGLLVESTPDMGTRFSVLFPLMKKEQAAGTDRLVGKTGRNDA